MTTEDQKLKFLVIKIYLKVPDSNNQKLFQNNTQFKDHPFLRSSMINLLQIRHLCVQASSFLKESCCMHLVNWKNVSGRVLNTPGSYAFFFLSFCHSCRPILAENFHNKKKANQSKFLSTAFKQTSFQMIHILTSLHAYLE